jgi:hypothetical protein
MRSFIHAGFLLSLGFLAFSACKQDKVVAPADPNFSPAEYVADTNTFLPYCNWPLDSTYRGIHNALENAHTGGDTSVFRQVFVRDGIKRTNGIFPEGTVIAKYCGRPDGTTFEVVGLVKRGGNYNPSGINWEWFILTKAGKIEKDGNGNYLRGSGANAFAGCQGCHTAAKGQDFVFTE